jgi:acyl-CoA synthetase (AMP-forming)/AMP-acid ligase II
LSSLEPQDICAIVYTSGSTSFPKPAMLHHRGLLGGAWWYGEGSDLDADERILVLAPTFHVSGISAGMLVAHMRGLPAWLMDGFDARQAIEIIERERITMFSGFDTMFMALLSNPFFTPTAISSIRSLRLATGPAMYDRVYAAFPNLRVT